MINDDVDERPLAVSNRFSDRALGGQTSGQVAAKDPGISVAISDHPNPARGVRVVVTGPGGGARATLTLDGKPGNYRLRPCGSYLAASNSQSRRARSGIAAV